MKKKGILNPRLCRVLAEMGHKDLLMIADAGFPIPGEIERIDLALACNVPLFKDVFNLFGLNSPQFCCDCVPYSKQVWQ